MANLENNYDNKNNSTQDVEVNKNEAKKHPSKKKKRRWWVTLFWIIVLFFVGILATILIIINTPSTQNWIAKKAIAKLNEDFKTDMKTEQVSIDFFGDAVIKGFTVKDDRGLEFIKAEELKANSDWYQLIKGLVVDKNNSIAFNGISLQKADIKVITYKGDSISNFIKYVNSFDTGEKDPNKKPFHLDAKIKILNSNVSIVNQNSEGDAGKWLSATNFNLIAPNLTINGFEISADIDEFNFVTERWGKKHIVNEFSGKLHLTDKFLALQKVKLHTDHTLMKGNIKFNLNNGSWEDFTNKVVWDMDINKGSYFSGYDISYFVTDWDNYKRISFNGKMDGALNDLKIKNLELFHDKLYLGSKDLTIKNILNGNFIINGTDIKTDFTYKELKASLPTFISVKLKDFADDFGSLKYNGVVRVTPEQVYIASGNLNTGIGNAKINQLYLTNYSANIPSYKGNVKLDDFDVSVITKNKEVRKISGDFQVDGRSFDINTMFLQTTSRVSKIEISDKVIHNITLKGNLNKKVYTGFIAVNDDKVRANVDGEINFQTSRIRAEIKGNVEKLHLNYFMGTPEQQIVSGRFDGRMGMSDINDLQLDTTLQNIQLNLGKDNYQISNAEIKALIQDNKRTLYIDAPGLIKGEIEGKFNLADLTKMIENGINKILVSRKVQNSFNGQNFTMNFDVEEGLIKLFSPDLDLPNGANINGNYIGDTNDLILNINADQLKYLITKEKQIKQADQILAQFNDEYQITEEDKVINEFLLVDFVNVKINTTQKEKQIDANIDRVEFKNNVFRNVQLLAENNNNTYLDIVTKFDYGTPKGETEGNLQSFVLNLKQSSNERGDYVFDFKPTQIQLNNTIWSINVNDDLEHSIVYEKDKGVFKVLNLNLTSQESQLLIKNATFKSGEEFDVNVDVNNFELSKLFEMLEEGNTMEIQGVANGVANVVRNKNGIEPLIDIEVKDITMQNRNIGTLFMNAKNSEKANVYEISAYIESSDEFENNHLDITGTIDNNPTSPVLDVEIDMNEFDIAFSNHFVEGVFSNLRGKTSGTLSIFGPMNDLDYSGDIALKEAGLKLDFVGVDYRFDDTVINISKGLAQLNNINIRDGRHNSSGTISGVIQFQTLASMSVALFVRTDNLLLLNTTQKDFDLFWGKVYTTGTLFVDGPVTALNLSTPEEDGMKILDNSVFTFNSNSSSNVDEFKMLRFLKQNEEGEKVVQKDNTPSGANMNVDFTANVGKGTTLNVLVGDDIGDITVRGTSDRFNFKMTRDGNLSMNGRYVIDNGTYLYKLAVGDVVIGEKEFLIERGSSISWDGNVMAPALNIKANYISSVNNVGEYLNMGLLPSIKLQLQAIITQTLERPAIDFDIEALDASSQVKEALSAKLNQGGEKTMQFGLLLFLNSFNVGDFGGFGVASVAEESGVNLILKTVTSAVNTFDSNLKVGLNYIKGNQAYRIGDRTDANLSYSLSSRLELKGTLGIPISSGKSISGTNENFYSKEFMAEYDLSKKNDRSLLLRGYTKPTDIGMFNTFNNQTYGVGIVWTKNFETIFKKNRNKNEKNEVKKEEVKKDSIRK